MPRRATPAPPPPRGLTEAEILDRAAGFSAEVAELEAELVDLVQRITEAVADPAQAQRAHLLEEQYAGKEAEQGIALQRQALYRELAAALPAIDGEEVPRIVVRLDRRAAQLERLALREAREQARPAYQAYRDRREQAREALRMLHGGGFEPRDYDAWNESPEALRKLARPRGSRRGKEPGADLLVAELPYEMVPNREKVLADTKTAEAFLVELLRPLVEPRRELRDFLEETDEDTRRAAQELRSQARALLRGDPLDHATGQRRTYMVPLEELHQVEAEEWQPIRAERIARGIEAGLGPEAFPAIEIASQPDGRLVLADGNHRLTAFRRAESGGDARFRSIPVQWLNAGGGPPPRGTLVSFT